MVLVAGAAASVTPFSERHLLAAPADEMEQYMQWLCLSVALPVPPAFQRRYGTRRACSLPREMVLLSWRSNCASASSTRPA